MESYRNDHQSQIFPDGLVAYIPRALPPGSLAKPQTKSIKRARKVHEYPSGEGRLAE
jgi:hypothetical protein